MTPTPSQPDPPPRRRGDAELEDYRSLIEPSRQFREGFGVSSIVGALFCGFLMVPGAIYLQLMIGQSMGPAATWVTVILFMEVGRRALKKFDQAQVVVLLMVAGTMVGGVGYFGELIWRAYLTTSPAALYPARVAARMVPADALRSDV